MQVSKERNPYLLRARTNTPHKYSYEMQTGQYHLLLEDGSERAISKLGTFRPKFRPNFTGFVAPKDRYEASKQDITALHFAPNQNLDKKNPYYTPTTRKFIGYAQQPYLIKGRKISQHLSDPNKPHTFKSTGYLKKSNPESKQDKEMRKTGSLILKHSATTFAGKQANDHFFETSFAAMTSSKPLPKAQKPTCYSYRCKHMQNFTFDEKAKSMNSTRFTSNSAENTLSKTFYDRQFEIERQEYSAIQGI